MLMFEPDLTLARRFVAHANPPGTILLVGITGAHDYGFPSPDSDLDMKGIGLAPIETIVGLEQRPQAFDRLAVFDGVECDLTINEALLACELLLKGNGNMLERIVTRYQLYDTPELHELRALIPKFLSRRTSGHYRGFFKAMRHQHETSGAPRAKTLLYAYRVALTGVHLLKTGEVVADLRVTAPEHGFAEALDLIALKQAGHEKGLVTPEVDALHRANWPRLDALLHDAWTTSPLPEEPREPGALHAWLVEARRRHSGW